jgi:hypothetical protein
VKNLVAYALLAAAALPGASQATGYTYPADVQRIYCADQLGACNLICRGFNECPAPDTMYICIYAADSVGVNRAHFRLEADYSCCDSIQEVVPCEGVTIESGDLAQGMTISFPLLKSGHFKALTLVIHHEDLTPPPAFSDHGYRTLDTWLERPGGETINASGWYTSPFYPDCFMESYIFFHPDTCDVLIGKRTDVKVQWWVEGAYLFGFYVNVADGGGWVKDFSPNSIWWTGCGSCPWGAETSHIFVEVPSGATAGTLSKLTISAVENGYVFHTFFLRAVEPVAVQKTSWGSLKDLFK